MSARSDQATCSRHCARKAVAEKRAEKARKANGWEIADLKTGRRYIDKAYLSEEVAVRERAELLAGYPAEHEWCGRLVVRETA